MDCSVCLSTDVRRILTVFWITLDVIKPLKNAYALMALSLGRVINFNLVSTYNAPSLFLLAIVLICASNGWYRTSIHPYSSSPQLCSVSPLMGMLVTAGKASTVTAFSLFCTVSVPSCMMGYWMYNCFLCRIRKALHLCPDWEFVSLIASGTHYNNSPCEVRWFLHAFLMDGALINLMLMRL